jgi:integrase/recombinase XerD
MGVVFSLLKENRAETDVDEPSQLVGRTMPKVESKRPKAYMREEIGKLFSAMAPDEYLRYRFFLVTGCREQEVQYASWDDLDLNKGTYHVTGEGKEGLNFVPKSHEERTVHLTRELVDLLKDHRKSATDGRWVFVNEEGRPEGHFLRKFKAIAKRAGLNCGRCQTTIRYGHDNRRREITITCATRPVCERHYLHRLRKTAATFWLHGGVDLMRIKTMLGHKSLAITQLYLSDEVPGDEQAKIDKVFSG